MVRGQAKDWSTNQQATAQALNGQSLVSAGKAAHGDDCLSDESLCQFKWRQQYDFTSVTL
jgi:hypothetical protein